MRSRWLGAEQVYFYLFFFYTQDNVEVHKSGLKTPMNTEAIKCPPASFISLAIIHAVTDVISLGLHTTVLPAAIAGAILNVKRYKGRFHGEMRPATPIGHLTQ